MTIPSTEALVSGPYTGNGVTTSFDYDFRIYDESELIVTRVNSDDTVTVLELTTDYTVTGVGDAGGGTIELVNGDRNPTGTTIAIEPNITLSQERPFSSQTSTNLTQIELSLDKLTSMARQMYGLSKRSAIAVAGVTLGRIVRGAAGTVPMWDADGNLVAGPTSDSVTSAQQYAEDAEDARDDSRTARDASQSARDDAQAARDASQSARDDAQSARDDAQAARDTAAGHAADTIKTNVADQVMTEKLTIEVGTGEVALDVQNNDIVGLNGVEFNDPSDALSEGVRYPKEGAVKNAQGAYDDADVDVIRVHGSIPRMNNRELLLARPAYQETILVSDGQPDANGDSPATDGQDDDQVQIWRDVLTEMPQYHPKATALVYAGDLTDRGHPSAAEIAANTNDWYGFEDKHRDFNSLLPFNEIDVLPGNHDREYRTFSERPVLDPFDYFKRWFPKQFYFKVKGNTVTIFMGDMGSGTEGYITDYVFEWWLEVCNRFKGYNKIVVTHQLLPDTFNATDGSVTDERLIRQGQRFVDAMTTYPAETRVKIDLWVTGHTNTDTADSASHQLVTAHNTTFVNVGLHIPSYAEGAVSDLTYIVMCATDGSADVILKRWNHLTKAFITAVQTTVTFTYPLVLSSRPEHDGRYAHSHLDPQDGTKVTYLHVKHNGDGSPANYQTETQWATDVIMDDRYNGNMIAGLSAGHKISLPGGATEDADNLTHSYGFGAAWTAEKADDGDTDYSADFVGYASGAGKQEDSRVEAFRGHGDGSLSTPSGLKPDYVSSWTTIDAATASTQGTDFAHNLGLAAPHVMRVEVFFRANSSATRVYSWTGSSPVADAARFDGSVSFKDANTITIGVGNSSGGVFAVDNVDGGTTQTFSSGQFLVVAYKIPGLPS